MDNVFEDFSCESLGKVGLEKFCLYEVGLFLRNVYNFFGYLLIVCRFVYFFLL